MLLQNQVNQLKQADAEKNKAAIKNYEKQVEKIDEQIAEAQNSSSTSSTTSSKAKTNETSKLAKKMVMHTL